MIYILTNVNKELTSLSNRSLRRQPGL